MSRATELFDRITATQTGIDSRVFELSADSLEELYLQARADGLQLAASIAGRWAHLAIRDVIRAQITTQQHTKGK